jgi:5-methyltetrahydrofolate--homocysteine methyltransferase
LSRPFRKTNNLEIAKCRKEIGVTLTESMAMWPASSVSGYYFGNPQSKYFGLGENKRDKN